MDGALQGFDDFFKCVRRWQITTTLMSLINVQDVFINLRRYFAQDILIKGRTFINFDKNFG